MYRLLKVHWIEVSDFLVQLLTLLHFFAEPTRVLEEVTKNRR